MLDKRYYNLELQDLYYSNLFTWFCGQLKDFQYYIDCRLNFDKIGDNLHTIFIKKYVGAAQVYEDHIILEYVSLSDFIKKIDYLNHLR